MSQESMQYATGLVTAPIVKFVTAWIGIIKAPANPPGIVTIHDSGFRIDVNQMTEGVPYVVEFMESQYLIWKRKDGALVVTDIERHES